MGGKSEYRWEKRRVRRKDHASPVSFGLFSFQIIILIVIFCLWTLGTKIIQMYAMTTLPCVEAVAQFGATENTPSVFKRLYTTSLLAGIFWLVTTAAFRRDLSSAAAIVFHTFLLGCIILLATNFRHLTISSAEAPDGFLAVHETVKSVIGKKVIYTPIQSEFDTFGKWQFGTSNKIGQFKVNSWRFEGCVWLDQNTVIQSETIRNDEYAQLGQHERWAFLNEQNSKKYKIRWPKYNSWQRLANFKDFLLSDKTGLEEIQSLQFYRPLTEEERTRFFKKQRCHSAHMEGEPLGRDCSYRWVVDSNAYYYGSDKEQALKWLAKESDNSN